jgi:hypothetical protein
LPVPIAERPSDEAGRRLKLLDLLREFDSHNVIQLAAHYSSARDCPIVGTLKQCFLVLAVSQDHWQAVDFSLFDTIEPLSRLVPFEVTLVTSPSWSISRICSRGTSTSSVRWGTSRVSYNAISTSSGAPKSNSGPLMKWFSF